jgi:DNA-binding GntR family transcriptional regulator
VGGLQIDSTPAFQTREEFAAHKLREAILLGHLKPGEKLDQNEIAELLGISRSPVRDALRTLAAEGLVEVIPHRGAAVAELSADEVEEIFLIRRILEGMAARLATQRIGPVQIAELQAIVDEIDRTTDLDSWLELNRRFHHTLYQAAGRPRLFSIVENLRNTTAPYVRLFIVSAEHIESAQESHRRIVDACAARDAVAAERETQEHMGAVCEGVLEYMKSQLEAPEEEQLSLLPAWSTP